MSATRIMPLTDKITLAHTSKHAKQARDWCPLCAGLSASAPVPAPARKRTPAPAPAPERKTVPAEVSESARIVLAFLGEIELSPSVDVLRALAKAGVQAPARKRAPRTSKTTPKVSVLPEFVWVCDMPVAV